MHWWFGIEIAQAAESQTVEQPGNSGEGGLHKPGDVPQMQPLVAQFHSVLQLLRIQGPPLGAAHTPTIRQRGCTT